MFNRRKDETPPATTPLASAITAQPPAPSPPPAPPVDNGLDVPPYRPGNASPAPITPKETPMARSPFAPALPPAPGAPPRPAGAAPAPAHDAAERRTLVVGRGISVQGTVQDAERLVVEGTMEAGAISGLSELAITHGGLFKGEVEVDEAEVAGTIDGTLTARHSLVVRATGRVLGTAKCRRLQVEDGGQITGRIEMLTDTPARAPAPNLEVKSNQA